MNMKNYSKYKLENREISSQIKENENIDNQSLLKNDNEYNNV